MKRNRNFRGWMKLATLGVAVAIVGGAIAAERSLASDHQDSPDVELNPAMDMTDVYAFPGSTPDRIVLVMNSWPFVTPAQTPSTRFDPSLLYQFKIDNNGDAREDQVIQVTFNGTGADQTVDVRGPIAPPVQGAMMNRLATSSPVVSGRVNTALGSPTGMQVFTGPREDPFFLDLEQFFRIIPDRRPVTGALSQLSDTPISPPTFRDAGSARDYVAGYSVLSVVIELPTSALTAGGNSRIGVWGTISR